MTQAEAPVVAAGSDDGDTLEVEVYHAGTAPSDAVTPDAANDRMVKWMVRHAAVTE